MLSKSRSTFCPPIRWAFVFVTMWLGMGASARAADAIALMAFVDEVADVVETRAKANKLGPEVAVQIEPGGGVDPELTRRFFGQQIRARLRTGGLLSPVRSAPLTLSLVVSMRGQSVWVIGELADASANKNIPIVVEAKREASLAAAFGARRVSQGLRTWEATQVAKVAPWLLDLCVIPLEQSPQSIAFATAHLDGIRIYRLEHGDFSVVAGGGPYAYQSGHRWPRVKAAWLGSRGLGQLEVVTTAGRAYQLDLSSGRWKLERGGTTPFPQLGSLGESLMVRGS